MTDVEELLRETLADTHYRLDPRLGEFRVNNHIYNAAAIDGELFMSTSSGLYVTDSGSDSVRPTMRRIAGISGATYGLAADPARDRVIVGVTTSGWGTRIDAVDVKTLNVTQGAQTAVGKESIAVVDDQIRVGGFASGDTKVLLHLDAKTLQIAGWSPSLSDLLRPGAIVWAGQHVLWATTSGDAPLSCVDPKNGAELAEYNTARGPVTSIGGSAYALSGGWCRSCSPVAARASVEAARFQCAGATDSALVTRSAMASVGAAPILSSSGRALLTSSLAARVSPASANLAASSIRVRAAR